MKHDSTDDTIVLPSDYVYSLQDNEFYYVPGRPPVEIGQVIRIPLVEILRLLRKHCERDPHRIASMIFSSRIQLEDFPRLLTGEDAVKDEIALRYFSDLNKET